MWPSSSASLTSLFSPFFPGGWRATNSGGGLIEACGSSRRRGSGPSPPTLTHLAVAPGLHAPSKSLSCRRRVRRRALCASRIPPPPRLARRQRLAAIHAAIDRSLDSSSPPLIRFLLRCGRVSEWRHTGGFGGVRCRRVAPTEGKSDRRWRSACRRRRSELSCRVAADSATSFGGSVW